MVIAMSRWFEPSRLPVVLFVFSLVVWLPSLFGGFVFDDVYLVEQQTCFRSLSSIPGFFQDPYDACDYRPMRYVTYAIDYAIAGTSPWIYHLTNVLFHAGSAVLLWFVIARLFARNGAQAGALAAVFVAMWAVHPALADAVVPAAGRRDVQCTFFYLLTLVLFLYRQRGPTWAYLLGAAVSFGVALLTKEMAVTAPAVALLLEVGARPEPLSRRAKLALLGVGVVGLLAAGGFTFYRAIYLSHSNMAGRWWGGTPWTNALTVLGLQAEYARIILFPARLVGDYSLFTVPVERAVSLRVVAGAGVVLAGAAGMVATWRRAPLVAIGLGWYGLAMSPVSHIFPHHELMAEHYLHLPLAGLAVAAAGVRLNRWIRSALLLILLALIMRQQVRVLDYRSDETLGWHVAREAPRNVRNLGRLSSYYLEHGNEELGTRLAWLQVRTAAPGSKAEGDAAMRLSNALERGGDVDAAVQVLAWVGSHNPRRSVRRELSRVLIKAGACGDARPILEGLLAEREDPGTLNSLGACALMAGKLADAERWGQRSLALGPSADAYFLMGNLHLEREAPDKAVEAYNEALRLDNSHVDALWVSATVLCPVHPDEARKRLARAAALVPADAARFRGMCPKSVE